MVTNAESNATVTMMTGGESAAAAGRRRLLLQMTAAADQSAVAADQSAVAADQSAVAEASAAWEAWAAAREGGVTSSRGVGGVTRRVLADAAEGLQVSAEVPLSVGINTIEVTITAADGVNSVSYGTRLVRAARPWHMAARPWSAVQRLDPG